MVGRDLERQLLVRELLVGQLVVRKLLVREFVVWELLERQLVERQLLVGQLLVGQLVVRQLVERELVVRGRLELSRLAARVDGPIRVGALGAVVASAAVGIFAFALAGLSAPTQLGVPWWVLVLVFLLAEALVVHLHFRSEAHSLSLSEAGLVFGLFFASPFDLLTAQLAGARSRCSSSAGSGR